MARTIKAGATSQCVKVFIAQNASGSTPGAGLTALTSASSGLTAYYIREGDSATTAIPLVTTGVTLGTWYNAATTYGFKEVDATNMPGIYELSLPNSAIASGADVVVYLQGAANMAQTVKEIQFTAWDFVAGAVASVVGNVGGNVTGSVGSVVSSVTAGNLPANYLSSTEQTELATAAGISPPSAATIATAVWVNATRTLTAFAFSVAASNLPADYLSSTEQAELAAAATGIVTTVLGQSDSNLMP